jgi:hypothetical protein
MLTMGLLGGRMVAVASAPVPRVGPVGVVRAGTMGVMTRRGPVRVVTTGTVGVVTVGRRMVVAVSCDMVFVITVITVDVVVVATGLRGGVVVSVVGATNSRTSAESELAGEVGLGAVGIVAARADHDADDEAQQRHDRDEARSLPRSTRWRRRHSDDWLLGLGHVPPNG